MSCIFKHAVHRLNVSDIVSHWSKCKEMLHLVELQPNFYQYSKFNPGNLMNQDIVSNAIKINAYIRCI